MKNIICLLALCALVTSCLNSATNFAMRSNVYQVVPEQLGERAAVTGSPTSGDNTINADKTNEVKSNISRNGYC